MAKATHVPVTDSNQEVIDKARNFWTKYQRPITIAVAAIIIVGGAYIGYKKFYKEPNEQKALDSIFRAEAYYREDSLNKALNGDLVNQGFLKVISKYGNTEAGNLARLYAGDCYLRMGDFANAEKQLKEFSTDSKIYSALAYKMLGDAQSEQGKDADALKNYTKAGHTFEADKENSAYYLSMAAALAEKMGKTDEAIKLYKEIKDKFPGTAPGFEADKYLGKLGAFN